MNFLDVSLFTQATKPEQEIFSQCMLARLEISLHQPRRRKEDVEIGRGQR